MYFTWQPWLHLEGTGLRKYQKLWSILIPPIRKSKSHTTTHFGDIFFVLLKVMAMWERHSFFLTNSTTSLSSITNEVSYGNNSLVFIISAVHIAVKSEATFSIMANFQMAKLSPICKCEKKAVWFEKLFPFQCLSLSFCQS